MVRVKHQQQQQQQTDDLKSRLAFDTYNIYQNSLYHCIHNHRHYNSTNHFSIKSSFIDWYLILRVAEDASISTIRKQYHNLALLLHPDKNKHPKAEFAFKLISQAYKCLSDDAKRVAFNLERWKNRCTQCSIISHNTHPTQNPNTSSRNSSNSTRNSTFYKIQQNFRALREQLIQEAKVIESCIRVHQRPKNDYPVFDPSRYTHSDYPHRRNHNLFYKKGAGCYDVQKQIIVSDFNQRRSKCETPIFELRTESHVIAH